MIEPTKEQQIAARLADDEDIAKNAHVAAASYLPPLSLVCLLFRKDSLYIRFHARQAFVLMCLGIIFWFLPGYFKVVVELVIVFGIFVGFYNAGKGKRYYLPVVFQILHWHLHIKHKVQEKFDITPAKKATGENRITAKAQKTHQRNDLPKFKRVDTQHMEQLKKAIEKENGVEKGQENNKKQG